MSYPLGKTKGMIALLKNKDNLQQIYDDYFASGVVQTLYEGEVFKEENKYKFSLKYLKDKYSISSYAEISFLIMTFKKEHIGKCKFCLKDYYQWPMRGGNVSSFCHCIANCSKCLKPFTKGHGRFYDFEAIPVCNSCHYKAKELLCESPRIPTQEEKEQSWLNCIEYPVFSASIDELLVQDKEYISFILEVLTAKVKLFKKITKFQKKTIKIRESF